MSDSNIEKRTRKIDLDQIIKEMFHEIDEINKSERSQGQKTQAFRRSAEKVTRALYGKRAKSKRNAIAPNTASKYLTKIRNQVTEKGWLHHSLPTTLERLIKKYPTYQYLIEPLQGLALNETRLATKALKDKLLQADRLRKAIKAINVNSTHYASDVNTVSKKFKDWKPEIQKLKTVNKADRAPHKEALLVLLEKIGKFFNELDTLKVDHEIMRWLVKDSFTSAVSSETSAFVLSKKKGESIYIDYPTIMARCEFLLSPVNIDVWNWEALATGIALATGRRAIEVLVQGEFVKAGTHKLMFSGQAKERGGVDRENKFEIYSLVEADKVIAAIETLRSYPKITSMIEQLEEGRHYQFNELVHNRTAAYLNDFMRNMMEGAEMATGIPDRAWVFKDTRAIYAAICFKLFFDTDKRWKKMDQDMFFQTLLGHSDPKAQAHYKQFKILRAGQKWESLVAEEKNRLDELTRFDEHKDIVASAALVRMHDNVKKLVEQDPDIDIKQRTIKSNFGGNYATIRKYLAIVEEALSFDTTLDTILKQDDGEKAKVKKAVVKETVTKTTETTELVDDEVDTAGHDAQAVDEQPGKVEAVAEVAENKTTEKTEKPKPRFSVPHQTEDGSWLVAFRIGDDKYCEIVDDAENMQDAGSQAWLQWQIKQDLPESMPAPIVKKQAGGWWLAEIKYKGNVLAEAMTKSKSSAKQTAEAEYRKHYKK